ncbi:MAG: ATP-dependent Clp protease adapter ClpS [Actinomycetaceae bacterium]|nr:ATP-dependent Clp protease adapter ClpS [Actinomycetaceae bacterium]MDU0970226.1 ATP-dependent Clp protease adapter ClpS [Actinomycetaceae bacterium]
MTGPTTLAASRPEIRAQQGHAGWRTVVWDDPINLMSYVARVFREHFGYSADTAHDLMMQVHQHGSATVSRGTREHMEADVVAMHQYGLKATLEPDLP